MSQLNKNRDMFRAWLGYRMIFEKGISLPLDQNLIPRFRSPNMSPEQKKYATNNIKSALRQLPTDSFWLFAFATAMINRGSLPHPFGMDLADTSLDKMHKNYQRYLSYDFKAEFEQLKAIDDFQLQGTESAGKTELLDLVSTGKVTMIALMMYHSKVANIDYACLSKAKGMVTKRLHRVVQQSLRLENEYKISEKLYVMRNNCLKHS